MSENEVSVMRYVKNESTLINLQKEKENLAKRFKVIETERDDLLKKIKQLTNQKDVISHTLNGKVSIVSYYRSHFMKTCHLELGGLSVD